MFDKARDTLIKAAIQNNPFIKHLGTIHTLSFNTNEHTCSLDIGLVGEPSPIHFFAHYEILPIDGGASFAIKDIHCERQWIEESIKIFLETKSGSLQFPINGIAGKLALTFL